MSFIQCYLEQEGFKTLTKGLQKRSTSSFQEEGVYNQGATTEKALPEGRLSCLPCLKLPACLVSQRKWCKYTGGTLTDSRTGYSG